MRLIQRPKCPPFLFPYLAHDDIETNLTKEIYRLRNSPNIPYVKLLGKHEYIELVSLLNKLFEYKCCYCESQLGISSNGEIEQFRPKSSVLDSKGGHSNRYWYLSADWRNLYLTCPVCNRNKSSRFPLEGEPAEAGWGYEKVIAFEKPLLLDPCYDAPDEHLAISSDGKLLGLTERGRITIETLILNRAALVSARQLEIQKFQEATETTREVNASGCSPYSLVWRQLLSGKLPSGRLSNDDKKLIEQQEEYETSLSDFSTESASEGDKKKYRDQARYIENVSIINFGPIEKMTLDMSAPNASRIPCFALLGENGVGKSTVLRAIAMTLSGKKYLRKLKLTSNRFLPERAYSGEVKVTCADRSEYVMKLTRNKPITLNHEKPQSLLLAYGATRLLPSKNRKAKSGEAFAKIDNLFDPFLPLTDPKKWLLEQDESRFADINNVLNSLLPADQQLELHIDLRNQVRISICNDSYRDFSELSDGYQGMLGIAVDMMKILYDFYDSMESAQGIVLIDELGNHFHPVWCLQYVTALRDAFPNIQFIYSTHDPLCLRGLQEGEVAVLRRDNFRRVYVLEDLPPVDKLQVEQLLKSEHFGLRSTVDPSQEERIKEYEDLLSLPSRDKYQEIRLGELIRELTDENYLGETRRERLALKLIDMDSANPIPHQPSISAKKLSETTIFKLRHIMNEIDNRIENYND
ncbi:AAA family ATPase [Pectobacterium punjabense]|uniref:AAA family ATPase n=1 Tax=Pectobacterium punjabense TaxID=2108399 RepID=UPI001969640D|nr:AAA family ATPase [Pectobacterium punjabense]MBN3137967.1 AAA family ATPase [Pectobacterium punjabense]MCE5382024.1 AAA family ATPase [Pectobacterium punjabense]